MVANALIYHPTVSHYLRFIATTIGRDKLLRTIQYFARFYAWHLQRRAQPATRIAPFDTIKKQFGLTRKLLRAGKNIEHLRAAAVAADSPGGDPIVRFLTVGRQLGYAAYLTFDIAALPDALGVRPWEGAKRAGREAYRAWAGGIACSVASGVYALYRLREREAGLSKEDGEGVVETKRIQKERAAINLQLVSDLCDLTIPTSALGWTTLDDGVVGLAGTISSLIGVYSTWKKTM